MAMTLDVSSLFRLPLGEFTAARNALAARLRDEGRVEEAATVKRMPRPSVSAWVVNQLFWRHRGVFDRLLAAGDDLRRAHAQQLRGTAVDTREPLEARRQALTDLSRLAAGVLADGSSGASPGMMRRIVTTLEALATYGTVPGAPRAGELTGDVEPPGFETLATLVPSRRRQTPATPVGRTVIPFHRTTAASGAKARTSARPISGADRRRLDAERRARRAAALAAVKAAEREVRTARSAAARADAALRQAAGRVKAAERARTAAEQRFDAANAELASARAAARQVAADAEDAAQAVIDAERTLVASRDRVARGPDA